MGFPIAKVVQQGGQFQHQRLGALGPTNPLRRTPHPVAVPPIMPTAFVRETLSYVVRGTFDQLVRLHHAFSRANQLDIPLDLGPSL